MGCFLVGVVRECVFGDVLVLVGEREGNELFYLQVSRKLLVWLTRNEMVSVSEASAASNHRERYFSCLREAGVEAAS